MRRINLQLFAENAAVQTTPEGEQANQQHTTAEEAKAQIAQLKAENAKLKNKNDVLATENAAKTKQLRQYMTEDERKEAEKKEAEAERDRQFKAMQREIAIMTSVNTYMDVLEMSKDTAMQYAEARADGNTEKEQKIIRQHMKAFKAKVMQSFLAERGEVNAGHGAIEGESQAVRIARSLPVYSTEIDESILKQYM